jgi:uncharacterized membrane protein (UPF0127 family)
VLGGNRLECLVSETVTEQAVGLQGVSFLHDQEGMYFPFYPPRFARFAMGSVSFPIDILFFRGGFLNKVVGLVRPGQLGDWTLANCSGVLEVRGGWTRDHGVELGAPLLGSL